MLCIRVTYISEGNGLSHYCTESWRIQDGEIWTIWSCVLNSKRSLFLLLFFAVFLAFGNGWRLCHALSPFLLPLSSPRKNGLLWITILCLHRVPSALCHDPLLVKKTDAALYENAVWLTNASKKHYTRLCKIVENIWAMFVLNGLVAKSSMQKSFSFGSLFLYHLKIGLVIVVERLIRIKKPFPYLFIGMGASLLSPQPDSIFSLMVLPYSYVSQLSLMLSSF